jgi:hypothetical protein
MTATDVLENERFCDVTQDLEKRIPRVSRTRVHFNRRTRR